MTGSMRRGAITLLLTLWQVSNTAVRVFVWGTIRENVVDLRPLSRTVRLISATALGLITTFLVGLLFSDAWRGGGPLTLLANDSSSTRGFTVPTLVIPLTLVAITIGWGYILAGALHTRPFVRWLVLLAFAFQILFPLVTQASVLSGWVGLAIAAVVVALLACFVVLPRIELPLPLEWSMVLVLCSLLLLLAFGSTLRIERLSGANWLSDILSGLIQSQFILIMPFLAISGLGWADFALEASGWVANAARRHATGSILGALLLVSLGYRLYGLIGGAGAQPLLDQLQAWAGAIMFVAGLALIGWWRHRRPVGGEVPMRLVTMLTLLLPAIQIALVTLPQLIGIPLMIAISPAAARDFARINDAVVLLSNWEYRLRPLLLAVIGLLIAWQGRRRSWPTLAAFGFILSWSQLCRWLTSPDGPLTSYRFAYRDVDAVALVLIALLTGWLLAQRQLTNERMLRLLAVTILLGALNQTDFLDNPFSPLFGFAGVAFLAFAVVWNILTAGNGFANTHTPGLPRESRLLMYLGYVLLTVSVSHWYFVSHNIGMQDTQSTINTFGFLTVGLPLAYLAIVELGEPLVRGDEPEEPGAASMQAAV